MSAFNDQNGVGWNLTIDLNRAAHLRSAGLDLFHPTQLEQILGHPLDQARAISILLESQARAMFGDNYTPEMFGEHLFGCFDTARKALIDEIKRFFRQLGRHNAAAAVDRVVTLGGELETAGLAALAEAAAKLQAILKSQAAEPTGAQMPGGAASPNSPPSPISPTGAASRTASSPGPRGNPSGQPGGGPRSSAPSQQTRPAGTVGGQQTTSTLSPTAAGGRRV